MSLYMTAWATRCLVLTTLFDRVLHIRVRWSHNVQKPEKRAAVNAMMTT